MRWDLGIDANFIAQESLYCFWVLTTGPALRKFWQCSGDYMAFWNQTLVGVGQGKCLTHCTLAPL